MIEAIPLSADSMIVIVTKVPDPEELDSRFARFSPEDGAAASTESLSGIDDVMSLISRLTKAAKSAAQAASGTEAARSAEPAAQNGIETVPADDHPDDNSNGEIYRLTRFYLFRDLETIIQAARVIDAGYEGPSSLYKNPDDGNYYLILQKADTKAETFNRICNILSEYGLQADYTSGLEELLREHMQVIVQGRALQTLGTF